MRRVFILIVGLFFTTLLLGQENQFSFQKTFELHSRNPQQDQEIEDGAYYKSMKGYYAAVIGTFDIYTLDGYRFMNQRRTINFSNSDVYIVLYSAQELNQQYGKPISSNTIQIGQSYANVTFSADTNTRNHILTVQTN